MSWSTGEKEMPKPKSDGAFPVSQAQEVNGYGRCIVAEADR